MSFRMTSLLACVAVLLILPIAQGAVLTQQEYVLGQDIPITLPEGTRALISAPDAQYRLIGQVATFRPRTTGEHTLILIRGGEEVSREVFQVREPSQAMGITISPERPKVGENALVMIDPVPLGEVDVVIQTSGGVFKYVGDWAGGGQFSPRNEGEHVVVLSQRGEILARAVFMVDPASDMPEPTDTSDPSPSIPAAVPPRIPDGPREELPVDDTLFTLVEQDSEGRERTPGIKVTRRSRIRGEERMDVEIASERTFARRIVIRDLKGAQDMRVGLDDVPPRSVRLARGPVLKSYAIDLGGLDFTNATVTSIAEGTELYKCAAWNFTTSSCQGTWVKLMDIVPGQPYDLLLYPGDPGYAETGVATVNSRKPVYHPGEIADLQMVVLDTQGYLVGGATITLTITLPDNSTQVLTTAGEIAEAQHGVYNAQFLDTTLEGNYTLHVHATAPGVDSTLISQFAVISWYPFDILRDIPATMDPFKGPLDASITIVPYVDATSYEVTEVLPGEFTNVIATGAAISADQEHIYLTWSNLSGNTTVSYQAQPPKVSPNLFILGRIIITYVEDSIVKVFEEMRDWFLAIDPEVSRSQGLVVYGDRSPDGSVKFRNWTDTLAAEQNSGLGVGDRTTWFRFRCLEARGECLLLMSDGGNDLNFAVFDTNSWLWRNSTQLDSNIGQDDQMQFDLECEDDSGDCIIAYEDTTTGDDDFIVMVWNASGLSGTTTVTVTGAENNDFDWIELYPQKGTDQIGIALQNDGGGSDTDTPAIYAGIWDGTAFGDWGTLTTTAPAQGNGRTWFKHYDCGWEGGTEDFLCFYGENNLNGVEAQRWDGSSWTNLGTIYGDTGDEVLELAVCGQEPWSDFTHDYLGVFFCDDAADLDGAIWNGSVLNKTDTAETPTVNTNAECGSNKATDEWGRPFECRWERTGDQAVFMWVAASNQDWLTTMTYTKSTKTYSSTSWTSGTQVVADAAGNLRMVQMVPNQASDEIFVVYADGSSDGGCTYWSGTSWDGTGCNNQAVFETSGARAARQWVTFDWFRTPPPQPEIDILTPNGTSRVYNYSGIIAPSSTSQAWGGGSTELPPTGANAPIQGTEFPSQGYVNVTASDNIYHSTIITGSPTGRRAYQSYNFSVSESPLSITSITITHEGYATEQVSPVADQFYIYIYNWSSDSYVLARTIFASSVDVLTEETLRAGFTDYVRNRQLLVLVEGDFTIGTGGNARAEIITDYIGVQVQTLAVLHQNVTVNASAVDDDGVGLCEWAFFYTNGTQASNFTRMVNTSSQFWYNISSTTVVPDGTYNLTVACNDTSNNRRNTSESVRIDNTLPVITLVAPTNATNYTSSNVNFTWNVTDIAFENMLCNLTINTTISLNGIVTPHGLNTTRNVTAISDGTHNWTVACVDDAGNRNISESWIFDIDTAAPTVSLTSPSAGAFTNSSTVNFTFTATDAHTIVNCSLRLDGAVNVTILNVVSGASSNITVHSLTNGVHRWNISCWDSFGFNANTTVRNFTVDTIKPIVHLNISNGFVFNNTIPVLNYTAIDNIDLSMTCNITVDNTVVDPNIASANNTLISRTIDLSDGIKFWNVTCVDDAGNINSSITRTFTVYGGPYVVLHRPTNGTTGNGSNINFTYYVEDGDGLVNCSLVIDGAYNQSNTTPVTNNANNTFFLSDLGQGVHTWNVECYDTQQTPGSATPFTLISDRSSMFITLNGPTAGQTLTTTPTRLNFTFIDTLSRNATCNVTVDGSVVTTNTIAYNGSQTNTSATIVNGLHLWNVTCIDLGGNRNTSVTQNFTVNVTFPLNITVVEDKDLYILTETAYANITTRNETGGVVPSNLTIDYIYTNQTITDVPWWNTSWAKRKPIYLTETTGVSRTDKAIGVNVTGLYGGITSCVELRVVSDDDLTTRAIDYLAGDDASWCYIVFNGSVSASASSAQEYHVYFNNTAATDPGDNVIGPFTIYSDDFEDGNINGWTAGGGWDTGNGNPLSSDHAHVDGTVSDTTIRPSSTFNFSGTQYDSINLSFRWLIETSWDGGDYIHLDFTNNSESSWTNTIDSLTGNVNDGTEENINIRLNVTYLVSGFNFRFRATTDDSGEDGGFDDVLIVGYKNISANITASVGATHAFVRRNTTTTGASGMVIDPFSTTSLTIGNYSVVARGTTQNLNNRAGSGYDWFRLDSDRYGPNITLIRPTNASTNHSGNITFIYTATDSPSGVQNCTFFLNGVANQTNATVVNQTGNNTLWVTLGEGIYTWMVSCYDTVGNRGNSSTFRLTIDDTAPTVVLNSPNGSTISIANVTFAFNVTDALDSILACNVSVDNWAYSALVNATNGSNTTVTIANIVDGLHYWNVTCSDDILNNGSSMTFNFTKDSAPVVRLHSPANGYGVNATNLTLYFNLTETNVSNCTLTINGAYNQTINATLLPYIANDGANNFTFEGAYGAYNWTVICFDTGGSNGTDTQRRFYLDNSLPTVTLNTPNENESLFSSTVSFNFTATDSVDPLLNCNLSINGTVNRTLINATSGTPAIVNVSGFAAGSYTWSVACTDDVGFSAQTEARNFTIVARVNVALQSPANASVDGDGLVNFTYIPQSLSNFLAGYCDLVLDNVVNNTAVAPITDAVNTFQITGISAGTHTWSVNCTDSGGKNNISQTWQFIVDASDPSVHAFAPNGTALTTSVVVFNWTTTDDLDTSMLCNITVNGTVQSPANIVSPNGTPVNATYSGFTDGFFRWNATCMDDSGRRGYSSLLNFTVAEPPRILLNAPAAGNRTRNQTVRFYWTPSDNSGSLASCVVVLDSAQNTTNQTVITSGSQINVSVNAIAEGFHLWTVNCTDRSGNVGTNSTGRNFTIDLTAPFILPLHPTVGQTFNGNNITFNWTPNDTSAPTIICNMTVTNGTGSLSSSNIQQANGTVFTASIANLGDGPHNWTVTCMDDVGNINTSESQSFIINQPDLWLNDSQMSINNTNPSLGQTVLLRANVTNIGGIPAANVIVEFWDGLPGIGIAIGNSTATVPVNGSVIFNVSWNVTPGYHSIWAIVDGSNSIGELNETNNNGTINLSAIHINITYPANNTYTSDNTPQVDFNITDYTSNNLTYRLFIDGTYNSQIGNVTPGSNTSLSISALSDGVRRLIIEAQDSSGRRKNSTPWTFRIDTTAPTTTFLTANATWSGSTTVTVRFNITDAFSTTINWTAYLDGASDQGNTTTNATGANVTFTGLSEGAHTVIIQAIDELGNIGNGTVLTFYVDATVPQPNITTANLSWFNTATPNITFTITDNLDPALNWSFFVDGIINTNGTATNGSNASALLAGISEGAHTIILQARDEAGNQANSTPITIRVDLTSPNVTLLSPANGTNFSTTSVDLNFTANDNIAVVLACTLYLDGSAVSQYNLSNSSSVLYTASGLAGGTHSWNASCIDNASNTGYSQTWRFFINLPDLAVLQVQASNSTPIENQTIVVNATVSNIGNINMTGNITVQFWRGDPDVGGVQIGSNFTIEGLNIDQNVTLAINHTTIIGSNTIYVIIDPPLATNGTYAEENESNNELTVAIWVGLFEVFAGSSANTLHIADSAIIPAYTWNQSNVTGSNVFVADSESSVSFTSLYGIGRNITNGTTVGANDFVEIDTRLNTSSLNDSVNLTFTVGGQARTLVNMSAFKRQILDTPSINSTTNVSFRTGILWDASDTNPGYYNGSQDIVFYTIMNQSQVGGFGTYDYEINIPAKLRDYVPGGGTVTFYTELR